MALEGNVNNNTALAETLMDINDESETTPQEKIKLISEEFKSYGLKLVVIDEQGILESN